MHLPSEKDNWKKCDKNIVTIALNVLYAKKEKIYPAYVSKHNSKNDDSKWFQTKKNAKLSPKDIKLTYVDDGIILQSKHYQHY